MRLPVGCLAAVLLVPSPVAGSAAGDAEAGDLRAGDIEAGGVEAGGVKSGDLGPDTGQPWFVDVAEAAGVAHPHTNRSFENPYAHVMEGYTALGAAVAVADFDGDGWEDLFVTDSSTDGRNRLYRNQGDLTFVDVAQAAGVAAGNDAANASADALGFDADGDGDCDLLVVRFGQSLLYRNDGPDASGLVRFTDITAQAGLGGYRNAITALAFDADGDGDLDLLLGHYFAPVNLFDPQTPNFFPESFETAANGGGLTLYRNDGPAGGGPTGSEEEVPPTFTDVTEEAGLAGHTGWTLDLGHADADGDGDQDLYVAADFGTDRFFRNDSGGRDGAIAFTDVTAEAIGIDTKKGMNADWGDFDNDGDLDVYVTNITDEYMREGNFLWQNQGDGTFADVARETGTWDTGWGWAGKFFDADNDGWLDLYVVNGWVSAGEGNYVVDIFELILQREADLSDVRKWPPMGDKSLSGYQRNELLHNLGGSLFRDVAAEHGVASLRDGRGVGVADLDHDGRLDLFVANANGLPHLFHNRTPRQGSWLVLELHGEAPNTQAVGARVRVTTRGEGGAVTRLRFVDGGNGFASQSSRRLHFGLGAAATVERVEVDWPSGRREVLRGVEPNRRYRVREGRGRTEPWPAETDAAEEAESTRPVDAGEAGAAGADEAIGDREASGQESLSPPPGRTDSRTSGTPGEDGIGAARDAGGEPQHTDDDEDEDGRERR